MKRGVSVTSPAIVVSVPHTGTRFLCGRLQIREHIHTVNPWPDILRITDGMVLFSPLRDPESVWRSTLKRWDGPSHGPGYSGVVAAFIRGWFTLHALSLIREIDFIAVDQRDDPRITDWTPVGSEIGDRWEPLSLESIYALPFVSRFYG